MGTRDASALVRTNETVKFIFGHDPASQKLLT